MLRFCGKGLLKQSEGITAVIAQQHLIFGEEMWQGGRDYFKRHIGHDITELHMIPVLDVSGGTICYGWQDDEANRELRMLKELSKNQNIRQFGDVFPDVREVMVCGCNELAYYFVRYLEQLEFPVSVSGKYWNYLGYESTEDIDFDDSDIMIIYAEQIWEHRRSLFQRVIRSASSGFECINQIYEENILAGNIGDTEGDFRSLLKKTENKDVVILGIDETAQDMYDLFLAHGVDIKCFAVDGIRGGGPESLLGKRVETIAEVIGAGAHTVLVDVHGKNSAWGNQYVDLFDYYGYERNQTFFLALDYTEIPFSNLVHVLKGKNVVLTGDERLSRILAEYLKDIELGDIRLKYIKILQEGMVKETDIVCTVYLWYGPGAADKKLQFLGEYAVSAAHTDYFSKPFVFVTIDQYKTGSANKYTIKQLVPKGILLNITFYNNGNVFFRGLADGHPDILSIPFNALDYNLFLYCIRLSMERGADIPDIFQLLLEEEMNEAEFQDAFPHWSRFYKSLEYWLSLQERFTSQDLFVIFNIAYAEMMGCDRITDLTQKVIYFDPHGFLVTERAFLAKWLESDRINEQIMTIHRDEISNICSFYTRSAEENRDGQLTRKITGWIFREKMNLGIEQVDYQYCGRFDVRFEDLKLHPKEVLEKICEKMGIPWSDSLMHTTYFGKASSMGLIRDFDLKPVFNKHEKYWSVFDRFRLYVLRNLHQRKYGYPYEYCLKFSRIQLWELFLKGFDFQCELQFESQKEQTAYYLWVYELIRRQLYENRKHEIMKDIRPEFKPVELGKTEEELRIERQKEKQKLVRLVRNKPKLVLYGLGKDGGALWDCLDKTIRSSIVLCDKKAENMAYCFHGKQVISPKELCGKYSEYEILVTSSRFFKEISAELDHMGISADRIICNTIQLWDGGGK